MTAFFDSSVLIAVLKDTDVHHAWSVAQLERCQAEGPVIIAEIAYCELSYDMASAEQVDQVVASLALERLPQTSASLFRAAKAFRQYKEENRGPKLSVLPDFLIGALAEVSRAPLVTANAQDFSGYFPNLTLVTPPKAKKAQKSADPARRQAPHR
jgi:predicted nucleic acid-binding protein